jgi:hypothetical protein
MAKFCWHLNLWPMVFSSFTVTEEQWRLELSTAFPGEVTFFLWDHTPGSSPNWKLWIKNPNRQLLGTFSGHRHWKVEGKNIGRTELTFHGAVSCWVTWWMMVSPLWPLGHLWKVKMSDHGWATIQGTHLEVESLHPLDSPMTWSQ